MILRTTYCKSFIATLCVFLGSSLLLISQNCIEYPEIDGSPCGFCVPDGWEIEASSPDIVSPGQYPCNPEESPSGGNIMHLFSNGSNDIEAVSTEFDIPGYVSGQEYYFGMYYSACGPHDVDILITINGEEYSVGSEQSWQYFELCFEPESATVSIEITVDDYDSGMVTNTLLDTGICDDHFCCALDAEIEEEFVEVCPGEEFELELTIIDEVGDVEVEWTCEPSSGLNYLDDPESIEPLLSIPYGEDEKGGTYIYTVVIEDEECDIIRSFELLVHPSEVPEFEVFLCELYEDTELPLESDDGYFGTWEGNFYFDELGGMTEEYTFTLDPGQDNCIQEWTYEFYIHFEEPISFDFQNVYCKNDDETYRLPEESEEHIEGDWDEDKFTPDELDVGIHRFTFEVDKEQFCARDFVFEIEIIDDLELEFELPISFCTQNDTFFLPDTSLLGIVGVWDVDFIDLNSAVEDQRINFNTLDEDDCYESYEYVYSVESNIANSFDVPDTICRSLGYVQFDPFSREGYEGYWTPSEISLDTIIDDLVNLIWNPIDSSNSCLSSSQITVHFTNVTELEFDLPDNLCSGYGIYELPQESLNGIAGSWNQASFNVDTLTDDHIDLIFSPNDNCAASFQWEISVNSEALDQTEFELNTELCPNAESFTLPLETISGVSGQWSILEVDPSTIVDSLSVFFYPENDNSTCYEELELVFHVSDLIEAEFDIPGSLCANGENFIFPTTSDNGIEGYWDTPEYDASAITQDTLVNVFHPLDPSCFLEYVSEVPIYNFSEISIEIQDISSCITDNGSVRVNSPDHPLEISLDGGASWNQANYLDGLAEDSYELVVVNLDNQCQENYSFAIESPETIQVTDLEIEAISDCSQTGASVIVTSNGSEPEYTVDQSNNWTDNNIFEGLDSGLHQVYVREKDMPDCVDSLEFYLDEFPVTLISDVLTMDVSDCGSEDASVEIIAQGQNLEYSVDNGINWQDTGIFEDLGFGVYDIVVRSADAYDCVDEFQVVINSPEVPEIVSLNLENVTSCLISNGSIEVIASGSELEYSIDNGATWQLSGIFKDLDSGDYIVSVRELNAPDCYALSQVSIDAPEELIILDVDLQLSDDCTQPLAGLRIEMNRSELEYSIDNGASWQLDNVFEELEEGHYMLMIKDPEYPDCEEFYEFEVIYPDCPCNDLELEMSLTPVDCLNPVSGAIQIESIEGNIIDGDVSIMWEDGTTGLYIGGLNEGWVSYTIIYDKNCELQDSIYIDSFDPLSFDLLSYDQDCQELGSIEIVNIMGGAGQTSYSIDGINFQENSAFTGLSAQEYQIFIEDLFNCSGEDSAVINDNSDLQVDLPGVDPISLGQSTFLNPLINESTIDSFEWYPVNGILNVGSLVAQVSPEETTTYTLTIYFGQCVETRSVTVEVLKDPDVYLGNMFSPNGDGNNDNFIVQSNPDLDLLINSFKIYDRWGNMVFNNENFKTNSEAESWDGRFNGKDAQTGVYVYMIEYFHGGNSYILSGSVSLLR